MDKKEKLAIVGYEEGLAGQASGWLQQSFGYRVSLYINPSDEPLCIDINKAKMRPASQFDAPLGHSYKGVELVNAEFFVPELRKLKINKVAILTSNSLTRARVFAYVRQFPDVIILRCIHPSAVVLSEAIIGEGVLVEPLCYVGYRAEIGNCTYMQAGSQIDHQTVLSDFVTLNPGVVVAGNSFIGEHTVIHTNSTIINRIIIGPRNIIGAGSVVIRNHEQPDCTLAGVPAKTINMKGL